MASIIKPGSFSIDNVIASAPKQDARGGKRITLNYRQDGETTLLTFQTPRMLTYGMNRWEDEKSSEGPKFSTSLVFANRDTDPKVDEFHKVLKQIDNFAIELILKNGFEWLRIPKDKLSRALIETNYTRLINTPVDKKTLDPNGKPDTFKLKFNKNEKGEFMTSFFNKDKEPVYSANIEEYFTMGSYTRSIIQCSGIWIINGKYGVTFRVNQMVVEPPARIGKSYAFIDDDSDDKKEEEEATPAVASSSKSGKSMMIQDSDDEEAPVEEAPKATVSARKPVKK